MPFAKLIGAAVIAAAASFATGPAAAAIGPEPVRAPAQTAGGASAEAIQLAGGGYWHGHRHGWGRGRAYRKGYRQGYRAGRWGPPPRARAYRKGFRQGYRAGRHDHYPGPYYRRHYRGHYGPSGAFVYDGPRVNFGIRF